MGNEKNCPDGPCVEVIVQDKEIGSAVFEDGARGKRTVWVGSEKTLPSRSLPIRRMGIYLGMRLLLRTTCCGTQAAKKEYEAGQFSTNSGK
jgi:hypothetical protein